MRRASGWVMVLAGMLLAVTGCGGGDRAGAGGDGGGAAAAAPAGDPAALVGWWQVAGSEQRVLFDPTGMEVLDGQLSYAGGWRADPAGRFVAGLFSSSEPSAAPPSWVTAAGAFRIDGDDAAVLDRAGTELVRLRPIDPVAGSGIVDPGRPDPVPDARPSAPLPAGLAPAGPLALLGSWSPGTAGSLEVRADGTWSASDGCNGTSGSWTAGEDGGLLATAATASTLIGCDGTDVAGPLGVARLAGLDGEALVLLDADGAELLRLARA